MTSSFTKKGMHSAQVCNLRRSLTDVDVLWHESSVPKSPFMYPSLLNALFLLSAQILLFVGQIKSAGNFRDGFPFGLDKIEGLLQTLVHTLMAITDAFGHGGHQIAIGPMEHIIGDSAGRRLTDTTHAGFDITIGITQSGLRGFYGPVLPVA